MIQINQKQKRRILILVGLLKKTDYNTKITDIGFIESSDLARIALTALTAVEEKILNLAKKTDNNTKISEIKK